MDRHVMWNILYPPRCPVCDRLLDRSRRAEDKRAGVCQICLSYGRPERIREPLCKRCGKPLSDETEAYCLDCRRQKHLFLEGRGAFAYRGMEESMYRFKNGNRRCYADFFGEELFLALQGVLGRWKPQVLVPVPIHRERRRRRGYNQAELLTRGLSARTGIPSDPRLLFRVRRTRVQASLDDRERRKNVKGAFAVRDDVCPYQRIILVDDIYTTGSTADAASQALLHAGAEKIFCASVCIGKGL